MMVDMDSVAGGAVQIEVQYASAVTDIPRRAEFIDWVTAALEGVIEPVEVVIRVVDAEESAALNVTYRDQSGPTNVLSFPADTPPEVDVPLLGDVVICAPVVQQEALQQGKPERAHWAHMVVHGVLHLLGYDHEERHQALRMEQREVEILESLGYDNPYGVEN